MHVLSFNDIILFVIVTINKKLVGYWKIEIGGSLDFMNSKLMNKTIKSNSESLLGHQDIVS